MSEQKKTPSIRFKNFVGGWKTHEFGDIVSNKSNKYDPAKGSEEIKCIELEHISSETGRLLGYVDGSNQASIKSRFKKGDVLFGKLRPYLKKYLYAPFDGVCTSEIWVLQGASEIDNSYLYHLVQTSKFIESANLSSGSKMPRADWGYVSSISYSIPSLPEQQKIAEFLAAVDQRIELLQAKKEKLEAYKKGVMQKIFPSTGSGQVPQLRFKADDGSEFPDWEERKLEEVAKIVVGGTPSTSKDEYWGGNIGWIGSGELKDDFVSTPTKYITEAGLSNCSTYLMPPNTILLAMTGATLGKTGFLTFGCCGNQSVAGFLPNENFDSYFLFQTLQFEKNQILSFAGGAAQVGINKRNIENLRIGLPCVQEQKKIASFLRALDEQKAFLNQQINQTQTWKKGLLQKMFV